MMEFIRTFREKQQTSKEKNIAEEAQSSICLDDFAGKIFIAYNGAPLIPVEESWTQKEILKKLEDTRASYISYRMTKLERPKVAAAL
jgi:ribosomal protein S19